MISRKLALSTTASKGRKEESDPGATRGLVRVVLYEFWLFGLKQAWACLFGAYLLGLILITGWWYPEQAWLYRYDFLFLAALLFQVVLLVTRLETFREASVILVFHVVATAMELFKTSEAIGSWRYPEPFFVGIGNVPLFAGFMYSAVGSYIARVWRLFDFRFSYYPPAWVTVVLVTLIYINFFSHHFVPDIRWLLVAASLWIFRRTDVYFRMDVRHRHMSLLLGWFLVALFIWFAENIATYSRIWLYPTQTDGWRPVSVEKLVAWYLLMLLSFVLVSLVNPPRRLDGQPHFAARR